jgi:hypothetical protein
LTAKGQSGYSICERLPLGGLFHSLTKGGGAMVHLVLTLASIALQAASVIVSIIALLKDRNK